MLKCRACTAWISFVSSNSQGPAQFLLSLPSLWDYEFPGGLTTDNIKYRGALFGVSLGCMWLALALNYLPPRYFNWTFRFTVGLLFVDLILVSRPLHVASLVLRAEAYPDIVCHLAADRRPQDVRLPYRRSGL